MRILLALPLVLLALAGCSQPVQLVACDGIHDVVLHFDTDMTLQESAPAAGEVALQPGTMVFAGEVPPFLSERLEPGVRIVGPVEMELWLEGDGVSTLPRGEEGLHLYTLAGSNVAYLPGGGRTDAATLTMGERLHVTHEIPVPPGGFRVEAGEQVRISLNSLLLTSEGTGHTLLVGGGTPSQVRFAAECVDPIDYRILDQQDLDVVIPGNTALWTGIVPNEPGLNRFEGTFELRPDTHRLTIDLRGSGLTPKGDMDLHLMDAGGVVWQATSPQQDETLIMWRENLHRMAPPGTYTVRVDSYSGIAYDGTVSILQEGPA